ncbi:MAG: hypothetical protein Q4G24_10080 [Paracoccus sp. (in: a-proteobacteria)]|uniref:hypothetical protein n=1 Tax=Paracoccus sp. TaxID=267 RepID=UPI0026E10C78|nr:hypothetical protein [Paracoccus sp. (in: a-proteobacteria)]MDO5621806.1 hypothetical protein [Paracoccus sp. (in: a-proteobacteria)]
MEDDEYYLLMRRINDAARQNEAEARGMVLAAISHLGLTAIRYRNAHEDAGQPSYCILDPAAAQVLDQLPVNPCDLPPIVPG